MQGPSGVGHFRRSEGTQLRCCVLGSRVQDEGAGSEFGPGKVLQLVAAPVRWIKLDMKVMVAMAGTGWALVHCHYIGQRKVKEAVVPLEQILEGQCE